MGIILVAALLAVVCITIYARGLQSAPRKLFFKRLPWYLLLGAVIVLALTGRLHWLTVAFAAIVPILGRLLGLLRFLPVFAQLYKMFGGAAQPRAGPAQGNADSVSEVSSRYLRMQLNHSTGMMSGTIILGSYQGRTLADLTRAELLDLYAECQRNDEESAALLAAYLDREHPDWRTSADADREHTGANSFNEQMSRAEAAEILDIAEDADPDAIRAAHRRLMQKNHPDRGGSTFLAAKINEAKRRLLE